jgi:hypothetical protein
MPLFSTYQTLLLVLYEKTLLLVPGNISRHGLRPWSETKQRTRQTSSSRRAFPIYPLSLVLSEKAYFGLTITVTPAAVVTSTVRVAQLLK